MTTYTVTLPFEKFQFSRDFVRTLGFITYDENGEITQHGAPFHPVDANENAEEAAIMMLQWAGEEYWLRPGVLYDENSETYNGMTEREYLKSLIVSVIKDEEVCH